jgi:KH domain-containing RNA-binding signal transduction-associated protein 3
VDVYREKQIKVSVKVLVPVKEHPKFNFVGKLLGPKGNSMRRLQEETMCKMAILGRGSMRDKKREEELRNSLDAKYAHLNEELHVEGLNCLSYLTTWILKFHKIILVVSSIGPPAEAHARIAYALAEIRKYLIPDR